jgi:hypothetical protein
VSLIIDPLTLSPSGWYRADSLTQNDGTGVASWTDSSGNGRTLAQGTAARQPLYYRHGRNGKSFLRFDGSNDYFTSAVNASVFLGAEGIGTIFVVAVRSDIDSVPDSLDVMWGVDVVGGTYFGLNYGLDAFHPYETLDSVIDAVGAGDFARLRLNGRLFGRTLNSEPLNGHSVYFWQHDKVGSSHYVRVGKDNLDDAGLTSAAGAVDAGLANPIIVGARGNGSPAVNAWFGDIYEVIIFPTVLTQAQRRGVQLYLTNKYALAYKSGIDYALGDAVITYRVEAKLPTTEIQHDNSVHLSKAWAQTAPMPGPRLWLRADDLALADGAAVATWPDASGYGNDVAQANAAKRPAYKVNIFGTQPAVLFDGTSDLLATSVNLDTLLGKDGRGTVFVVAKPTSFGFAAHMVLLCAPGGGGGVYPTGMYVDDQDILGAFYQAVNFDGSTDTAIYGLGGMGLSNVYVWMHDIAGSVMLDAKVYGAVDRIEAAVYASTATGASTGHNGVLSIGGQDTLVEYLKGYIAEVIVYDYVMNDSQRAHVFAYLSNKYGTTYPATGDKQPVWLDVTGDVRADPIGLGYGISGSRFSDRVAAGGKLSLVMRNSEDNSASTIGYYSPNHPSHRAGWRLGVPLRTPFTFYGTTYYKWRGRLTDVHPIAGKEDYGAPIAGADYMDELNRTTVPRIAVQTNVRADDVLGKILLYVPRLPENWFFERGSDVYPFAFDNTQDERMGALAEFNRVVMSELGAGYVRGDDVLGGELYFENRFHRNLGSPVMWDTSRFFGLDPVYGMDNVTNRAVATLHPRRVDAAATHTLFSLGSTTQSIPRGVTIEFDAQYRDPSNGRYVRIGGDSMVVPVAGTDYVFTTTDGLVATGQLDVLSPAVAGDFGANSTKVRIKNNGPKDGTLTKFELRGKGLYSFEPIVADVKDVDSVEEFGEQAETFDMPYQVDATLGFDAVSFVVSKNKDPFTRVPSVSFFADTDSQAAMHALAREIGDRISVTESTSGLVAVEYFIQSIRMVVTQERKIVVMWELAPADATDYWILGVPGRSELGVTTVLGFGGGS